MEPLDILVIDEAAQLKECESIIPLLLLVGDERQLPAMVESSVCILKMSYLVNLVPRYLHFHKFFAGMVQHGLTQMRTLV
jgi:superfamily I DNA and/or RNA helicase